MGWLALAFNYNKGQAIAGLRVAEGNAKVQGSSQQDYDLGLIGIEVGNQRGSTGYSGWSAIGQLNAATGDSGQAQFNARPEPPSAVPGGGQRNYACYFGAFWC